MRHTLSFSYESNLLIGALAVGLNTFCGKHKLVECDFLKFIKRMAFIFTISFKGLVPSNTLIITDHNLSYITCNADTNFLENPSNGIQGAAVNVRRASRKEGTFAHTTRAVV